MGKLIKSKIFWAITLYLVVILLFGGLVYKKVSDFKDNSVVETVPEADMILEDFNGYILYKDSSEFQKTLFAEFKEKYRQTFAETEIDLQEQYIDVYSRSFVADVYTLEDKDEKFNRVGGLSYIQADLKANYLKGGVTDFYIAKKIYQKKKPDEFLTRVNGFELVEMLPTTYNFVDKYGILPEQAGLQAYEVTYRLTYENEASLLFQSPSAVTVVVANYNGVWTVMQLVTEFNVEEKTPVNIY